MKINLYSWDELALNEAFDRTVVNIHLRRQEKGLKSFVLCGCAPKVGTTALSINLAIAMAKSGWKTVLIDADLRKGQENKRISENKRNLSDFLAGKVDISEMICHTNHENLYYVSSGDPSLNPIQLLCSTHMTNLFDYVKTEFDYIIIDAPAPSAIVDSCILANQADEVILIALWGETTIQQIKRTQAELEHAGSSIMGIIINSMDKKFYGHYNNIKNINKGGFIKTTLEKLKLIWRKKEVEKNEETIC